MKGYTAADAERLAAGNVSVGVNLDALTGKVGDERPTPSATIRRPEPAPEPRCEIRVWLPLKVVSEANTGGKLHAKLARKAATKAMVAAVLRRFTSDFPLPCVVTMVREGGKRLDTGGNLEAAFKVVRDSVALWLGCDDADSRVRWVCKQRAAFRPGIEIRVRQTNNRGAPDV